MCRSQATWIIAAHSVNSDPLPPVNSDPLPPVKVWWLATDQLQSLLILLNEITLHRAHEVQRLRQSCSSKNGHAPACQKGQLRRGETSPKRQRKRPQRAASYGTRPGDKAPWR